MRRRRVSLRVCWVRGFSRRSRVPFGGIVGLGGGWGRGLFGGDRGRWMYVLCTKPLIRLATHSV
jgi:hypothetical protein